MEVLRLVGGGATDVTDAEVLSLWYHLGQHALLGGFGLGRRLGLALLPVASFLGTGLALAVFFFGALTLLGTLKLGTSRKCV